MKNITDNYQSISNKLLNISSTDNLLKAIHFSNDLFYIPQVFLSAEQYSNFAQPLFKFRSTNIVNTNALQLRNEDDSAKSYLSNISESLTIFSYFLLLRTFRPSIRSQRGRKISIKYPRCSEEC